MASNLVQYIDGEGRLTIEGLKLFADTERRLAVAENKLAAIAAVSAPSGGATTDAEARTAINAIRTAAG